MDDISKKFLLLVEAVGKEMGLKGEAAVSYALDSINRACVDGMWILENDRIYYQPFLNKQVI